MHIHFSSALVSGSALPRHFLFPQQKQNRFHAAECLLCRVLFLVSFFLFCFLFFSFPLYAVGNQEASGWQHHPVGSQSAAGLRG